jgi:phage-related protein
MANLFLNIISDLKPKGFTAAEREMKKMSDRAVVAASALTAGLAVGAWKAAQAASDLGESTNAVGKVFGDSAKVITDFGRTAASTVGLSQREFQQLATSTGSLLTNMGYGTREAADATTMLATRAADMASVFNTDVSTALDAINAGLRGETEPLRKFGVSMNDATLKAKALELGLYSGTGALDANARAAAAQALIMEQSASTAGDFAATSDGAANAQRILGAQLENLAASLGQALLPALELAIGVFSELADWAGRNQGATQALIVTVGVLAAGIVAASVASKAWAAAQLAVKAATAVWTAAQWLLNAALTANPIGLVVAAVAALIAGLVLAYQKSETFRAIVDQVGRALKTVLGTALELIIGYYSTLWAIVKKVADVFTGVFTAGINVAKAAIAALFGPLEKVLGLLGKVGGLLGSVVGKIPGLGRSIPSVQFGSSPLPALTPNVAARYGRTATLTGSPGSGGLTVNVTMGTVTDPIAAGRQIVDAIRRYEQASGSSWRR